MRSNAEAAELLGVPVDEVVDVMDSPGGDVINTTDGNSYIVVPDDRPDSANQVGLMFVSKPHEGYVGPFQVYAGPGPDGEPLADSVDEHLDDTKALKLPTKAQMVELAKSLGVEIRASWNAQRIYDALGAGAAGLVAPLVAQNETGLIPPANDANTHKPEAAASKIVFVDDVGEGLDRRDGDGEGHPTDPADGAAEANVGAGEGADS